MKPVFLILISVTLFSSACSVAKSQSGRQELRQPGKIIIFKFDDLSDRTQIAFQKVSDIIVQEDSKAGFGIIGKSCEGNNEKEEYFKRVKDFNNTGRIEIWAHGYDHFMNGDTLTEFRNMPYQEQYDHFKKTIDLVFEKCGITMHTFGTPGNKSDSSTTKVINQFPQIQVYLFPFLRDTGLKQLLLTSRVDMEKGTGKMDYEYFVKNYNAKSDRPYMVLQGHPGVWKEDGFNTLTRIIAFLKSRGATFMTPYEYCRSLKPL